MLGRPLLSFVVESVRRSREVDAIVVATSNDPSDDPIAAFASDHSVACFRGDLDNVAGRLLAAAQHDGADAFVRVNGDSPLIDPALIDRGVTLFRRDEFDLVSNVFPRTFPKGQSVEVIGTASLAGVMPQTTDDEREHVTRHFYTHADRFRLGTFQASTPHPELQLSVDTPDDFTLCEDILRAVGETPWQAGWERCAEVADMLLTARAPGAHA